MEEKDEDTNLGLKTFKPSIYGRLISEDNYPKRDESKLLFMFKGKTKLIYL